MSVIDGKEIRIHVEEITFNEHDDFSEVQLMRTGTFSHPFFEEFEVTEEMFKSFRKNFRNKVKKVELAIDYSHMSGDKAAGWITEVILREKNTELWVAVNWTPEAVQKIMDREFRYMSADFSTNYVDNETGKKFGATLNGGALTNRPFIKDMDAVLSDIDMSDEKRQAIMEIYTSKEHSMKLGEALGNRLKELREAREWSLADAEEAMNDALDASDGAGDGGITASTIGQIERGEIETPSAPVMSAFAQIYNVSLQSLLDLVSGEPGSGRFSKTEGTKTMDFAELKEKVSKLSDSEKAELGIETESVKFAQENKELCDKVEKLEKESKTVAKEAEFTIKLAEGTAVEAQREAFISGNLTEFIKLAVPINMDGRGTGEGDDTDTSSKDKKFDTSEKAQTEVLRLAKEKQKDDKDLTDSAAHNLVFEENKGLYDMIYGDIQ